MTTGTSIEWTDHTWNPVSGCTKVSAGCDHCYAESIAERFAGTKAYPDGFKVTLWPDRIDLPFQKRSWKGRRVFVCSMADLFHKDVPDEFIAQVFAVMALTPEVTYQVLTKRHGRMRALLSDEWFRTRVVLTALSYVAALHLDISGYDWPLPNVWLGVSVEDQHAELRIPALLDTPAAVRFLSCEPLLGSVSLNVWLARGPGIDWVIVGGESGPGARPTHPEWARSLRDQCQAAGTPFFFKQWGEWAPDEWTDEHGARHVGAKPIAKDPRSLVMHPAGMTALTPRNPFDPWERGHPYWHTVMRRVGKKAAGRFLDGRTWDEYPSAGGEAHHA